MAIEQAITLGIEYFPDPAVGRPAFNNNVYFGKVDLDPEVLANRITVTVIQEDGTRVPILPAAQPLLTGSGGVILYLGSPVSVVTDKNYSIKVTSALDAQVYYVPFVQNNAVALQDITNVSYDSVVSMVADATLTVGQTVVTTSYYGGWAPLSRRPIGGAEYNIVTLAQFQAITTIAVPSELGDHTLATGDIAMVLRGDSVFVDQWGAVADGSTDDTVSIQTAINVSFELGLPVRFTSAVYIVSAQFTIPDGAGRPLNTARIFGNGSHNETAYVTGTPPETYGTTLKAAAGFNGTFFYLTGTRKVEIHDMLLLGAGLVAGSKGIFLDNATIDTTIHNVKFFAMERGIQLGEYANVPQANDDTVIIEKCWFDLVTDAIKVEGAAAVLIKVNDCEFYTLTENAFNFEYTAPDAPPGSNILASGCMFLNFGAQAVIRGNNRGSLVIRDSFIEKGIILDADGGVGGQLPAVTIDGCTITTAYSMAVPAIKFIGNGNLQFTGNTIESIIFKTVIEGSNPSGSALFANNRWFGKPFHIKQTSFDYGDVVEINESSLFDLGTNNSARTPVTNFRINGKTIDFSKYQDFSGRNTKEAGSLIIDDTPALNGSVIETVLTQGTTGTLNGGATTGGITSGTDVLVVNDNTEIYVGCYIAIAGVAGIKKVVEIVGTTITIDVVAGATVAGAAVSYSNPVLKKVDPVQGSFTMTATSFLLIANTNVKTTSKIFLSPTNSAAATLTNGASSLFAGSGSLVDGVSFTVSTANAGNAVGTENFNYVIFN